MKKGDKEQGKKLGSICMMFTYRTIGSEGMIRVKLQPLRSTALMYKVGSWNCTSTTLSQDLAKSEGIERYRVTIAHLPAKSKAIYTYLRSIHMQIMNPTHNMHLISLLISKFTLSSPLY